MCQECAVESRRAGGVVAAAVPLGYGHDTLQSKDSPVKVSMLQAHQGEQHQQDHDSDLGAEQEGEAEEPSSEDEEYNLAAIYAKNSHGQEAAGSYYVGPESMVDQEIQDEENYNFRGVDDDDEYDLTRYFDDEPGAVLVDAKIIENSIGEDKDGWMSATAEEINQIDKKNVNTDYTQVEFNEKYGTKKITRLFSKVVATKKPSTTEREDRNARSASVYVAMEKKELKGTLTRTEPRSLPRLR